MTLCLQGFEETLQLCYASAIAARHGELRLEPEPDPVVRTEGVLLGERDLPEMLRVKALLLGTMSSPDAAASDRSILESLESARAQKAIAWELRTATTAARLWSRQGRTHEARDLLRATHDQFTQGLRTADLLTAKQLLGDL